jgi:hypothetical protein
LLIIYYAAVGSSCSPADGPGRQPEREKENEEKMKRKAAIKFKIAEKLNDDSRLYH